MAPGANGEQGVTKGERGAEPDGNGALLAALRADLLKERARREQVERDLQQLREETSSGPFENSLDKAHRQIADLQAQLETERKAREKLTREFDELHTKTTAAGASGNEDAGQLRTQLANLKQQQQEVLASVEAELASSQERERDLAAKLRLALDSPTSPPFEKIADLTKENLALRARLDEEHRQNRELASKLETAQRVTDLIFKMQASRQAGSPPVQVAPASEPDDTTGAAAPNPPAVRVDIMPAPTRTPRLRPEPAQTAAPRPPRTPRPTRTPRPIPETPRLPPPAPPARPRPYSGQMTRADFRIPANT